MKANAWRLTFLLGPTLFAAELSRSAGESQEGPSSWSLTALQRRLTMLVEERAQLNAENVRLQELVRAHEERAHASELASACVGWRQTAGCDPGGAREPSADKTCEAEVSHGASGYCECRGTRVNFTCDHAELFCRDACAHASAVLELATASTESALRAADRLLASVSPSGEVAAAEEAQGGCELLFDCRACAAREACAWCLSKRQCVEDEPWICTGEARLPPLALTLFLILTPTPTPTLSPKAP